VAGLHVDERLVPSPRNILSPSPETPTLRSVDKLNRELVAFTWDSDINMARDEWEDGGGTWNLGTNSAFAVEPEGKPRKPLDRFTR
jgi:hypothetical protein